MAQCLCFSWCGPVWNVETTAWKESFELAVLSWKAAVTTSAALRHEPFSSPSPAAKRAAASVVCLDTHLLLPAGLKVPWLPLPCDPYLRQSREPCRMSAAGLCSPGCAGSWGCSLESTHNLQSTLDSNRWVFPMFLSVQAVPCGNLGVQGCFPAVSPSLGCPFAQQNEDLKCSSPTGTCASFTGITGLCQCRTSQVVRAGFSLSFWGRAGSMAAGAPG